MSLERWTLGASEVKDLTKPNGMRKLYRLHMGLDQPEDLTWNWRVTRGSILEPAAVAWMEHKLGRTFEKQVKIRHQALPLHATIDGLDYLPDGSVDDYECKASGIPMVDAMLRYYTPQMAAQAMCMESAGYPTFRVNLVSVLIAPEPVVYQHDRDAQFEGMLAGLIEELHWRLVHGKEPADMAAIEPPPPIEVWKHHDMTGSNAWSEHAATWIANKAAAETFAGAVDGIKVLVPDDAKSAEGYGITVTRAKNRSLTIKVTGAKRQKKGLAA